MPKESAVVAVDRMGEAEIGAAFARVVLDYRHWVVVMGKVEKIEQEVEALSPDELARFRAWFLEFDWAAWDRQIEQDVCTGRLDALAEQALRDHAAGKTTRL